jgi:hypothetical protein
MCAGLGVRLGVNSLIGHIHINGSLGLGFDFSDGKKKPSDLRRRVFRKIV